MELVLALVESAALRGGFTSQLALATNDKAELLTKDGGSWTVIIL